MPITLIERKSSRESGLGFDGRPACTLRFYAHGRWTKAESVRRAVGRLIPAVWGGLVRLLLRPEKLCPGLWHIEAVYGPPEE